MVGASSAYANVTHCLGVMGYWGGAVVAGRTIERSQGGALMHIYEELAQHLGQLEVGRDVVMRSV